MSNLIKCVLGLLYCCGDDGDIRFLLLKRQSGIGKIEWIVPTYELKKGDDVDKIELKGVSGITGIPINFLESSQILGTIQDNGKSNEYYLIKMKGNMDMVDIKYVDGYFGVYKWASIPEILNLIYDTNLREFLRKGYNLLQEKKKIKDVKQSFLDSL